MKKKGGAITFGYGTFGPVPGLAVSTDGISFPENVCVCNPDLTGTAGTVYLHSSRGSAMAITVNSTGAGYTLRRWDGQSWIKL